MYKTNTIQDYRRYNFTVFSPFLLLTGKLYEASREEFKTRNALKLLFKTPTEKKKKVGGQY
jgi:hypothetical protein